MQIEIANQKTRIAKLKRNIKMSREYCREYNDAECIRSVWQRLICAITAQYTKKKSTRSMIELSKRLLEKATNDIDDRWIHVTRATSKSKRIAELFFIFYIISFLQRRSVEKLWRHQTTHEYYRFCERREYFDIQRFYEKKLWKVKKYISQMREIIRDARFALRCR